MKAVSKWLVTWVPGLGGHSDKAQSQGDHRNRMWKGGAARDRWGVVSLA